MGRTLIEQLGSHQGLTEADIRKVFAGLSAVDQVAISLREKRIVLVVTGKVTESTFSSLEAGVLPAKSAALAQ